jgi:hypothetical protein
MNFIEIFGRMIDRSTRRPILVDPDGRIVTHERVAVCPPIPVEIPGITAADAFDANDCMGTIVKVAVPKSGIIYSATFYDLDDEGLQTDLEIFNKPIAQTASDAAFAPTDVEILTLVTELNFVAFDDHGTSQTSEIMNIGKAYTAPDGIFYIQAVARGVQNIAAANMPRFQLQIISDDTTWSV